MKNEIQPHNNISVRTMIARKNAVETQSGVAYRARKFDPAQFCMFSADEADKNWQCVNCGRKIAKSVTFGNKPIVMCLHPDAALADNAEDLQPVINNPDEVGGVVTRRNFAAPTFGVGFELKKIFSRMQIELPPSCVCNSRVMMLNDIGIDEVEKMRDKILGWFESEANKRAIYFDVSKANKILDIAIRRAKNAALKEIAEKAKNNG